MKIKNIIRIILISLIIILSLSLGIYVKNTFKKENKKTDMSVIEKTIPEYNYNLRSNTNDLYKDKFIQLEKLLETDFNNEEYIKLISELFIIDFYSLEYKVTNTDIGGLDFIHTDIKDNFIAKATNTIYKYVESNIYNNRKQELPEVVKTKVESIDKIEYTYDKKSVAAYEVKVDITYEKDLGYEASKTLVFIKENNKYSIVEMR